MKRYSIVILLVLAFLIYFFIDAVLGDMLAGDLQVFLKKRFGENDKYVVWGVALMFLVGVSAFGVYHYLKGKKSDENSNRGIEYSLFEKARAGQREEFERRSAAKLAGRDFIDIEVSYTVKGSNILGDQMNVGVREGQREEDIHKVFGEADGRLLIIGTPGSGKTTLLLTLAKKLLDDYPEKIPVVLDIATWQPRFKTIEDWAIELLPDMGFNKALAKEVVGEDKILPLFDGLDELVEGSRASFLRAVEDYGRETTKNFVITSRVNEYDSTIDAAVERQVIMEPFEMTQIRVALQKNPSPERNAILAQIEKDEHFREAIKTPFYLNAVQHLYAKKSNAAKYRFEASDLEGRKREIEKAFVDNALNDLQDYDAKDASRWLGFLADRMNTRGLVRFELVDMQYDWEVRSGIPRLVALILRDGCTHAMFGFVFVLLGFTWLKIAHVTIYLLIVYSIITFFMIVLLPGASMYEVKENIKGKSSSLLKIRTRELVVISFEYVLAKVYLFFRIGLVLVPIFMLCLALIVSLIIYFLEGKVLPVTEILEFVSYSIWIIPFLSLFLGVVIAFSNRIRQSYKFTTAVTPYMRFVRSIKLSYFSILQHWHLCFLLRKRGIIPRYFPSFLSRTAMLHILETDGGSWRFRHKKIQDYFANLWERNCAADFPDGYRESAKAEEE